MIKRIYEPNLASSCFFRTAVTLPNYKILLQITEKCNFRCSHCFVNSTVSGNEMLLKQIIDHVIPNLIKSNVTKVTLTGGEPLVHRDVREIISALCDEGIAVSVCTNGSLITDDFMTFILGYPNIHFNVSLDGLYYESHGRFRGNLERQIYDKIIKNIELLGKHRLLNGILTTPNKYASISEYDELCSFVRSVGAKYILMNPLSPFGRGNETQMLAYTRDEMIALQEATLHHNTDDFEVVYIRFPNYKKLKVGGCPLGSFPYIFTNGDVVICPYMVFASENSDNDYNANQFTLYNIFSNDISIKKSLEKYHLPNGLHVDSELFSDKGCCAIKISKNQPLEGTDYLL